MTVTISGSTGISQNGTQYLVGQVCWFAMTTAPSGFLQANGAAISRTTYSALFTAIGTTFGAGDGSTTFNVPDMRGYFARGYDNGRGIDPSRAFGSTQTDGFGSHTHTATDGGHTHTQSSSLWQNLPSGGGGNYVASAGTGYYNNNLGGTYVGTGNASITNSNTGGTETRPKNVALLGCIYSGV